jgi:hypothetical protein
MLLAIQSRIHAENAMPDNAIRKQPNAEPRERQTFDQHCPCHRPIRHTVDPDKQRGGTDTRVTSRELVAEAILP